jgi:hypothetical protein
MTVLGEFEGVAGGEDVVPIVLDLYRGYGHDQVLPSVRAARVPRVQASVIARHFGGSRLPQSGALPVRRLRSLSRR